MYTEKIDITPALVSQLIGEVAPLVEFATRWKLDLGLWDTRFFRKAGVMGKLS